MNLGETVPSVCSETSLTLSADGSEVSDIRVEEVLEKQEEKDRLAVALPAVKAADKVLYVCNIVVCNSGSSLYCGICILAVCCVVFRCEFTVKMEVMCWFEGLVRTSEIKHYHCYYAFPIFVWACSFPSAQQACRSFFRVIYVGGPLKGPQPTATADILTPTQYSVLALILFVNP